MRVGLKSLNPHSIKTLKQEYLFFDIIYFDVEYTKQSTVYLEMWGENLNNFYREVEELDKIEIIRATEYDIDVDAVPGIKEELQIVDNIHEQLAQTNSHVPGAIITSHNRNMTRLDILTRCYARGFDLIFPNSQFIPIVKDLESDKLVANQIITYIVLSRIPEISPETSWEKLIEFKSDEENRKKLLDLRNWMIDISQSELDTYEIETKLDYLLEEYKKSLEIHKLKTKISSWEIPIITPIKFLENFVKLKWTKSIESLIDVRKRKIHLLEGEQNLKGREVAYLTQVEDKLVL